LALLIGHNLDRNTAKEAVQRTTTVRDNERGASRSSGKSEDESGMPPRSVAERPHREAGQLRVECVALTMAPEAVEQSVEKSGTLAGSISNEVGEHARRLSKEWHRSPAIYLHPQIAREVIELKEPANDFRGRIFVKQRQDFERARHVVCVHLWRKRIQQLLAEGSEGVLHGRWRSGEASPMRPARARHSEEELPVSLVIEAME